MLLDLSKAFSEPGSLFPFKVETCLTPQNVMGETVTFDTIALEGACRVQEDTVHLEGRLRTQAHGLCARCLMPASEPLVISFSEIFRKDAADVKDGDFRYEGKVVSLDELVLTLVLLNLPMRFLCDADCAGSKELQA